MSSNNFGELEKQNNSHSKVQTDQKFGQYLEQLPMFEARPQFQTELRSRLTRIATVQTSLKPKPGLSRPRWVLLGAALCIALIAFGVTLFFATNVTETQVASAFDKVYDPESQAYVNSNEASQSLGFVVNAPSYLPDPHSEYKVESAIAPAVFTNTLSTNAPSEDYTRTLQVILTPKNPAQNKPQFEIYEMRVPLNINIPNQTVTILRTQNFQPIAVQGASGYFVEGRYWRLVFQVHNQIARPNLTKKPGVNTTPRTSLPGALTPRPLPLMLGRAGTTEPDLYFLQFVPGQQWGAGAKTILWQKNGVLFMLVSGQTTSQDQMQRVAQSFQEIKKPGQKS